MWFLSVFRDLKMLNFLHKNNKNQNSNSNESALTEQQVNG